MNIEIIVKILINLTRTTKEKQRKRGGTLTRRLKKS